MGRTNAEHDESAAECRRHPLLDRLPELAVGGDLVIGGYDEDELVAEALERLQRSDGDGGRGIAAGRLEDGAGEVESGKIVANAIGMTL